MKAQPTTQCRREQQMGHRDMWLMMPHVSCEGTLNGVGHLHCPGAGEGATEHPQCPRRC